MFASLFARVCQSAVTPITQRLAKPFVVTTGSYFYFTAIHTHQYNHAFESLSLSDYLPKKTGRYSLQDLKKSAPASLQQDRSRLVNPPTPSLRKIVWNTFLNVLRFFHLCALFFPAIATMPLLYFDSGRDRWMDIFVGCVQRAGVVWIKAFQYLSHRRDIIGQELANKFVHLREHAPTHSWKETEESFRKEFGKSIEQIFDSFEKVPIASGSVSQVYQAVYQGKKVAVKVRHPGVETYIERDMNLLFAISRFLSKLDGRFELPVCQDSMKKTLVEQIDFNIQARNLYIFNEMFKNNRRVKFPKALKDTSSVLVEEFMEGDPITKFQNEQNNTLNKVIARLGAMTFFEMLIKNNFIHADCHGGNIMVEVKEKPVTPQAIDFMSETAHKVRRALQRRLAKLVFTKDMMRELYLESKVEEDEIRRIEKESRAEVKVALIDVGMVIQLDEVDQRNFTHFIKSVLQREPEECALTIYSLSMSQGKKIIESETNEKSEKYYKDLLDLFSVLNNNSIKDIDGTPVFKKMLDLIREHKMKLDGQFATLLTNMLVMEGIARGLNPEINLMRCAIPYFKII